MQGFVGVSGLRGLHCGIHLRPRVSRVVGRIQRLCPLDCRLQSAAVDETVRVFDLAELELRLLDIAAVGGDAAGPVLREFLVPVTVRVHDERTVVEHRYARVAGVARLRVVRPVLGQQDAVFAVLLVNELVVGADPGHPVAGVPVAAAVEPVVAVEIVVDLAERDQQTAGNRIVGNLVPFARQRAGQIHWLAPRLAFIIRVDQCRRVVVRLAARQTDDPLAVGRTEHADLAHLVCAFDTAPLRKIRLRFAPLLVAVLVESEVRPEIDVRIVVVDAHPFLDVVAVGVLELHEACHGDDGIVVGVVVRAVGLPVPVFGPGLTVVVGIRCVPSVPVAGGVGAPARAGGDHHDAFGAVGQVEHVQGRRLLRTGPRRGDVGLARPGGAVVVADLHDQRSLAVPLRERGDQTAALRADHVGLAEVLVGRVE